MLVIAKPDAAAEVSCDRCGAAFRIPGTSRELLWVAAAAQGWQAEELGGMVWHRCPDCVLRFN
ncbi:hypothetical protein [Dactylosporangium sp. CA-092794]|uniref:hypothetical protein n=1 Tax=Dactylosporangium sp. CA-092794 TaxID=3239929 RepID=UPI003D91D7B2